MPDVAIAFWRDIPAQVIVGSGRGARRRPLDSRFEKAIDAAAMRGGLTGSDAYLEQWTRSSRGSVEGDADEIADREAADLERRYDSERLRALIQNHGWEDASE